MNSVVTRQLHVGWRFRVRECKVHAEKHDKASWDDPMPSEQLAVVSHHWLLAVPLLSHEQRGSIR